MKSILIVVITSFLSLGMSVSASADPPDSVEQVKCRAQLHKCLLTGDIDEVFGFIPLTFDDCFQLCGRDIVGPNPACSLPFCAQVCAVAYDTTGAAAVCPNPMAQNSEYKILDQLLAQSKPQSGFHELLTAKLPQNFLNVTQRTYSTAE